MAQFGQQDRAQALPDPRLLPARQAPPAVHARLAAHFAAQRVPGDPVAEHEQDTLQHSPIGDRYSPGLSAVAMPGFREWRFDCDWPQLTTVAYEVR